MSEKTSKKIAVGLMVFVHLNGTLMSIIQRRGEFNHEKMIPETFPGGFQATVHGRVKVDTGETAITALLRETAEELGKDFLATLVSHDISEVRQIHAYEDQQILVINYGVLLPIDVLRMMRLGPSSGGIRLIEFAEYEAIQNLKNFNRTDGVLDRKIIAMSPDTKEALRKGFVYFGNSKKQAAPKEVVLAAH